MIVTLGVRVLQIIFSAVVLGLAAVLVAQYGPGHAPSLFSYGAFCGAASIIFALIGIVACFFEKLQGIVTLALDGLTTFFLLAGGIAYAVTLKVGSCGDIEYLADHAKTFTTSDDKPYGKAGESASHYAKLKLDDIEGRCKMAQADTAFLWFAFACAAACVALSFMTHKRGSSSIV